MATSPATPEEFATYLGTDSYDYDRAALILQLATDLCSTIVDPLPDAAKSVVLAVAARAFNNVSSLQQMGLGSAQASFASTGMSAGGGSGGIGGLFLSRADVATLRRMSGRGGAFSIDPTPSDAGQSLPVWDTNTTWLGPMPIVEDYR